jgi:hypothetical protein
VAAFEDILGSILLWGIILAVGVMLLITFTRITVNEEKLNLQFDAEQSYSFALDSVLSVTETGSQRSFADLLGSAAYYRRDQVLTKDGQIKLTEEFARLLDLAYPGKEYYFEVNLPIKAMHLNFVLDGSDTLKDEEQYLKANFANITATLNKQYPGIDFTYNIYILDLKNSTRCQSMPMDCSILDYGDIYFNETYTVEDLRKHRYRLFRPENFGKEDEVWKSDWETAMMSRIIIDQNDDLSKVKVYLPITDSLPSATEYFYPCPSTYGFKSMERDVEILRTRNYVIDTIFSTNSDPILYCDDITISTMEGLASYYNGFVIINRDNFADRLPIALQANLDKMRISIGAKQKGKAFGLERKLPMPNGGLANAQLIIYEKG